MISIPKRIPHSSRVKSDQRQEEKYVFRKTDMQAVLFRLYGN